MSDMQNSNSEPKPKYLFDFKRIREILFYFVHIEGLQPELPPQDNMLEMHKIVRSYWQECMTHIISLARYYTTINIFLLTAIGSIWLKYEAEQLLLYFFTSFAGIVVCCEWLTDIKNIAKEAMASRIICAALEIEVNCRVVEAEKYVLAEIDKQDGWKAGLLVRLDKIFNFPILLLTFYSLIISVIIAYCIYVYLIPRFLSDLTSQRTILTEIFSKTFS
ncbi:MAG: hypothetical protein V1794_01955 [Candidatus Glassbacteria bacterium]